MENKQGTIVLPTGTGKTFVGATIAAKQLEHGLISSVLIVVPTTVLLDQWKEEIIKFYDDKYLRNIELVCIQTAYKNKYDVDLLIIDEIHTALSPQYRKIFENVTCKQTLGLTATTPGDIEYKKYLDDVCKIVYIKTFNDVAGNDVVSDYQIYNLEVKLNKRDRARYQLFDSQFKRAQMELGMLKLKDENLKSMTVFDIAQMYSTSKERNELVTQAKKFWSSMTMRKWVCYDADSKVPYILSIIQRFKGKKWIIFNKSIKFAEQLKKLIPDSVVYHSKMRDDERKIVLDNFEKNIFNVLIAVDALNAGLNVPEVDAAICVSGVSTELTNIQQLGRIVRFRKDKVALFINLYSGNTVEENWVTSKTKNLKNVN